MLSEKVKDINELESVFDIEELLYGIKDTESEIEHLENLKKWRNKKIDEKIASSEAAVHKAKQVILNTMLKLEPKKKTIPFPGVGKVTRRVKAANWQVEDDDKLLTDLTSLGLKDKVIEIKEVLVKKSLNSVLDDLEKSGKPLPMGIKKTDPSESLSVSFEEEEKIPETVHVGKSEPIDKKLESLDVLEL